MSEVRCGDCTNWGVKAIKQRTHWGRKMACVVGVSLVRCLFFIGVGLIQDFLDRLFSVPIPGVYPGYTRGIPGEFQGGSGGAQNSNS